MNQTNTDPMSPELTEKLSMLKYKEAAFEERRDAYLSAKRRAEEQIVEAMALEEEAACLVDDIEEEILSDATDTTERRKMALRHAGALSLAAQHRAVAEKLETEIERLELLAEHAAGEFHQAWSNAAEVFSDEEFAADIRRIQEDLFAAIRRRAGMYSRAPVAMKTRRVGFSFGLGISREVYCALKDLRELLMKEFKKLTSEAIQSWGGNEVIGKRPNISPFKRGDIVNPLKKLDRIKRLENAGLY